MSDKKQAQLNGAYYGPQTKHSYHPGRGSGCGCGCCCLITLLLKLIATVVIIIGLAALIVWLIFRPINKINFYADDVALQTFNLTNNQVDYKLSLNITIRNPNKKIGVYYDRVDATAYYDNNRLKTISFTPFYQGHKNTTVLHAVFEGQKALFGEELQEFNQERTGGVYSIDVGLSLRVRFKLGKVKTTRFRPKINCELKVPVSSTVSGSGRTECEIDY